MDLDVQHDADALAARIADALTARVAEAQRSGRRPRVVLTGGTIAVETYRRLTDEGADWTEVEWWFGDERFVPTGHEDRNDAQMREAVGDRIALSADRLHVLPGADGATTAREAADAYADTLPTEPFDLVLLGMGPDGHVASLFPGHPQLHERDRRCVEVLDSPKPPPERVTMTFAVLSHATAVWFLVAGEGKAAAVARALATDGSIEETPARGVRGIEETRWFLDTAAASAL